jgi:hypothetical protein
MKIEFQKADAFVDQAVVLKKKPSITSATRLETQPTAVNPRIGLQAPVADPLWMLARQWQFNEFQGEDAGSPLRVSFAVDGASVTRFRPGKEGQEWQTLQPGGTPIEIRVEAEPIWKTHARLRGETGLELLRRAPNQPIRAALLQAYGLDLHEPSDPQADQAGLLWSIVLDGRTLDAKKLADDLTPLRDAGGNLTNLPGALVLTRAQAAALKPVLEGWLFWLDNLFTKAKMTTPPGSETAWSMLSPSPRRRWRPEAQG